MQRFSARFAVSVLAPLAALAGSLAPASAPRAEPIDPQPDGIGIYADLEARVAAIDLAPGTTTEVYLILTRGTSPSGPGAWTGRIDLSDNIAVEEWILNERDLNLWSAPEFCVGQGERLYVTDAIVLVTIRLQVTDTEPASLWIKNGRCPCGDGHWLAYVEFDELEVCHALNPSSGSTDEPIFVLNGPPPVAAERSDWSRVKGLYR